LIVLGAVAIAEPILLLNASRRPTGFAAVVLVIQALGALLAFAVALRSDRQVGKPPPPANGAGPDQIAAQATVEPLARAG
jgi:hypothetical protein